VEASVFQDYSTLEFIDTLSMIYSNLRMLVKGVGYICKKVKSMGYCLFRPGPGVMVMSFIIAHKWPAE
jgi:hypothetical protein